MAAPELDFRNTNTLWGSVIAGTLGRLGLRHAVIAPGSRSTPLTIALARHPRIEAIPVLDERSAGFFALGLARQQGRAVALVCTSGTAAANFFPAVIEAQESGVPLLVLTADRPPELRACAAGQAIDQQKLYGGHVNLYHELAVPEASPGRLRYLRQTVVHAFERTRYPVAGPVHLNVPFRDPLPPVPDGLTGRLRRSLDARAFFAQVAPPTPARPRAVFSPPPTRRGLIVVGPAQPADPAAYAAAVARIAGKLGWPVLADGLNPLRGRSDRVPGLVAHYDAVLRSRNLGARLRPDAVLALGEWPTSKVLREWLAVADARTWLVQPDDRNHDALHGRTQLVRGAVETLTVRPQRRQPPAYLRAWVRADRAAARTLAARFSSLDERFEGKAGWLLARHLPPTTRLFIASSMPVRDVEFFWPAGHGRARPFFNRGANGIDGTLSTALGVAHGGRPAVLLCGDLALLHDTNGFLLRPKLRGSLTIVLINNHGGGIFEMLPVAKFDPPFEEFFATPQEVDFDRLCGAYGAEHVLVRDWDHFAGLVAKLPAAGVRVLEVRTDRKRDATARRALLAAAAEAAGRAR
ncbi:MAG TPA: 2-succinyl-5-enolpyruvyl-6-hydroxy-3-cyclohexene-1-carboxylic-acid synthase [Opitutaceae bacterium]|nr:2-succinyl-5-enolpyruvyl-6-hydroxy-3-cyclohexene-1-carboxylic-acid synthase [Opitutaceae bacterium]